MIMLQALAYWTAELIARLAVPLASLGKLQAS